MKYPTIFAAAILVCFSKYIHGISLHSANNAAQPAATTNPANSPYPESSGPVYFDPVVTKQNVTVVFSQKTPFKGKNIKITNNNPYAVYITDIFGRTLVEAGWNVWEKSVGIYYAICPEWYDAKEKNNVDEFWKGDSIEYICELQGWNNPKIK